MDPSRRRDRAWWTRPSSLVISTLIGLPAVSGYYDANEFGFQDIDRDVWNSRMMCPDYRSYSMYPHTPFSKGPLKVPFQRPAKDCRTFESASVEAVIQDLKARLADPDLAQLFENAFPNTLDTTIRWHIPGNKTDKPADPTSEKAIPSPAADLDPNTSVWKAPQTFVVTGDINAEWLRDSTNQLAGYQALAKHDDALSTLIAGAIQTQAEFVIRSPYCNAFQPPPPSGLGPSNNGQRDVVNPIYEPSVVFECKWEIDSLAAFLSLGNQYHDNTGSTAFLTPRWFLAVDTVMRVLQEQSEPTFDASSGAWKQNVYRFRRMTDAGTETLALAGAGHPLGSDTGLVRSAFRPSDDSSIFGFFIPGNAMMAVELNRTAAVLEKVAEAEAAATTTTEPGQAVIARSGQSASRLRTIAAAMKARSGTITAGIWKHGIVQHRTEGPIFAFEVDGYGSTVIMDDANVPSLLSLPMLGFVPAEYEFPVDTDGAPIRPGNMASDRGVGEFYNPADAARVYANTRRVVLGRRTNPYFLTGPEFSGIGGPHVGPRAAWPMSLLVEILTAPPVPESTSNRLDRLHVCHPLTFSHIRTILRLHARLGLIHETVQVDNAASYTRSWFAWANAVFSQVVLRVARECGSDVIGQLIQVQKESKSGRSAIPLGLLKEGESGYNPDERLRELAKQKGAK